MKQTCISSNSESAVSEDKDVLTQSSVQYSCPGDSDPKTFTKCCNDKECCDGTLLAKALVKLQQCS